MTYYFGSSPQKEEIEILIRNCAHVLCSFAYWKNIEKFPFKKERILVDSGAFSIWNSNLNLNINDYISFLREHKGQYQYAINFDDIDDDEQTYENQKYIEKQGIEVLPVFHVGDRYKYLQRYIDEGYNYICLGVRARPYSTESQNFLRKCFKTGSKKSIKFHGLACPARIVLKFPFYSIDNTSWKNGRRFAQIPTITGKAHNRHIIRKIYYHTRSELSLKRYNYLYNCYRKAAQPLYLAYFRGNYGT